MTIQGQTYQALWKQADEAEKKDLPRTQYDVLMKIVAKAQQEQQYGQLMAAELTGSRVMGQIAPDSLQPAVDRMATRWQLTQDPALKAVYAAVLKRVYDRNPQLERSVEPTVTLDDETCRRLVAVKAADYKPLTIEGRDSRWFDNDMLSVVGYELNDYRPLHAYYSKVGNRVATLMAALEQLRQKKPDGWRLDCDKAPYLRRLDSLIAQYGDLPECGEVAIERYHYLDNHTTATAEQKWNYTVEALRRWGTYSRMAELRNSQQLLTRVGYDTEMDSPRLGMPGQGQTLRLTQMRGVTQLTMRLYAVGVNGDTQLTPANDKDYKKLKPLLKELATQRQVRHYEGKKSYELFEDSIEIPALPVGVYLVEMETLPQTGTQRCLYFVSNVRTMAEALPGNRIRYVVVDAQEGQPVKGATIELTGYDGGRTQKMATLTTNADGEATYHYTKNRPSSVYTYTSKDKACLPMHGSSNFYYYSDQRRMERTHLFTDRAIYRPGQTVRVAAVSYEVLNGTEQQALTGKRLTLTLRDANYKVVSEQTLTTDSFGTCAANFTLPSGGLTGHFTIQTQNGSCSFSVEEYKRPTFEVVFDEVKADYHDGDTLPVSAVARSYAGVPVQGAKVKYTVERRSCRWWWAEVDNTVVAEGVAVTDAEGRFTIDMPMTLPQTDRILFYNFVCQAAVTDLGGETHQGQIALPLGNRPTAFSIDLPEKIRADKMPQVVFRLRNAAGNDVEATAQYRIDGGEWQATDTNSPTSITQLKSGRHTLEAVCKNDTVKKLFTVFSLDDKRPAAKTDEWFYLSDTQFPSDGSPVTLQVGSSDNNVHIVYTIISGDKVIESGYADRSNQLINRKLTYKSEYGNGLLVDYSWVKHGRFHHFSAQITRPLPDKKLKLKWQTFRDRLTPGQQEEWTLTVTTPDGRPASAQLMATLYDKSLDQIVRHNWAFTPYRHISLPSTAWQSGYWGNLHLSGQQQLQTLSVPDVQLSHLDASLFPTPWTNRRVRIMGTARPMAMAKQSVSMEMDEMAVPESANMAFDVMEQKTVAVGYAAKGTADTEDAAGQAPDVALRENLQETVFFYPQLLADANGVVTMKFTLPESLTTWRFMGLAHTPDLCYGMTDGETVAKKDLMVQPNMPRFVREGDEATITARIVNTSDRALNGTAWLTLIDPDTEQTVLSQSQPFTVNAGETTSTTFNVQRSTFNVQHSLLIAKVVATADGISDGEQHYLPVLSNSERVTVTVPFTQNGPGTKTVDLTELFGGVTNNGSASSLTAEYTNNPAWLMVQALPAVGHPHDDCAVCQAASLYANSIGQHIISQIPQAKTVFEQWKRESREESTLSSQLEKNQEVKDLLLDETPWAADADRETEQRQRLADFFDDNLMQQRLTTAVAKLKKLQRNDGAWSWWPEMPGSTYMTVAVAEMLTRLHAITRQQAPDTRQMLDGAFKFLGREMTERVAEMKKQEKKGRRQTFPGRTALEWLYICRLDGRTLPASVQQANDYLIGLLKKETASQTIYEKALTAIILNNKTYIKSLKEYTVYKEETGRYYDTPRAGYSWRDYRIPTQVAAIEAIQLLTPDDRQTLTDMRRWLLQQKRTQAWDTPLNSVDAVYAFLSEKGTVNSEILAADQPVVLRLDGRQMATPKPTAGIGYVKTVQPYQGEKTFTAEKTSDGTSWGAVYAQFTQSAADISDQASGISVKREILTAGGDSSSALTVGSRVTVRLTITADRDYDFVQLQDKRAACMEPVRQTSGYDWHHGCYVTPRDNVTNYYFDRLPKGKHVIETEYYVDRAGQYQTGTCTVQCAYAPEYRGTTHAQRVKVKR